jgi:hypothetical protein
MRDHVWHPHKTNRAWRVILNRKKGALCDHATTGSTVTESANGAARALLHALVTLVRQGYLDAEREVPGRQQREEQAVRFVGNNIALRILACHKVCSSIAVTRKWCLSNRDHLLQTNYSSTCLLSFKLHHTGWCGFQLGARGPRHV